MAYSLTTSFPSLYPTDAHEVYSPTLHSNTPPTPPPEGRNAPNQHGGPHASHPAHPPTARVAAGVQSHAQSLSALYADENAIATRKANIRRFGAGWLKPMGIGKTLQGMEDEKAEKEEQEAAAMREHALMEEQAAAEAHLAAQEAAQRQQAEDAGEVAEEPDLDADIPEASSVLDETEALTPGEEEREGELVDEAEGGLPAAEGEGDGDYALAPGQRVGDESGMGHDLDDDVPEAGSYQHTDTDVDESSSSSEEEEQPRRMMGRWSEQLLPPSMAAARQSLGGGGMGGSVFGSSPAMEPGRRSHRGGRRSGA